MSLIRRSMLRPRQKLSLLEAIAASRVLGRGSASAGSPEALTLGTGLRASGTELQALGWNVSGRQSGLYYIGFPCWGAGMSNNVVTLNKVYATPFFVGNSCSFDQIAVAAIAVASSVVRLGIYTDAGGKPGTLIVDAGTVACTSDGMKTVSISQTLAGVVWLAAVGQTAAPRLRCIQSFGNPCIGITSVYSTDAGAGISQTGITGALPDPWGSSTTAETYSTAVPAMYLRKQ